MKTFVTLLVGAMFASGCGGSEKEVPAAGARVAVAQTAQDDTRARLAEAEAQIKNLQATVEELKGQLAAANAGATVKELPVRLKQREAPNGSGNILQVFNISEKPLSLKVTMTNATLKKAQVFDVVVKPAKI